MSGGIEGTDMLTWDNVKWFKPEEFDDLIFPYFIMNNIANMGWGNIIFLCKSLHRISFISVFCSYLHSLGSIKFFIMWNQFKMIFFNMLSPTAIKFQIFYMVVHFIMIDMMNNFLFRKYTTNMLFHDVAMFAVISFNTRIRMGRKIYPFITMPIHDLFDSRLRTTFITTEKSRSIYSFWDKYFIAYFAGTFLDFYSTFDFKFKTTFCRTMFLVNGWKGIEEDVAIRTCFS